MADQQRLPAASVRSSSAVRSAPPRAVCGRRAKSWIAAIALIGRAAFADSPLTSTDLATAYRDVPEVAEALEHKQLTPRVLQLLLSDAPNDRKLAVANAVGWGGRNGATFLDAVARAHQLDPGRLTVKVLSASELFVAGYLVAMDDYLELAPLRPGQAGPWGKHPEELLQSAARALPQDFAVQYAWALVRAQGAMTGSWCKVFQIPDAVLKHFAPAQRNLRPGAVESAQGYLALYEEECPGSKAASAKQTEELNEVYGVAELGGHMVAATQAGVVVWDPLKEKPAAIQQGDLCSTVLGWRDAVWAGCDHQVLRWDGNAFKTYLLRSSERDGESYAPMCGPKSELWVRLGTKVFAYDAPSDAFSPVEAPWSGAPYDALIRRNGEVWWIDFLRAIVTPARTFALKSDGYPGADPRRLSEDASGTLWVEDFESGLFRLDSATGKFVHEPGVAKSSAGVTRDGRGRLWQLEYTQGLVMTQPGTDPLRISLRELGYLHSLVIDSRGDIWVSGQNQLLRLRDVGGTWERHSFRVVR